MHYPLFKSIGEVLCYKAICQVDTFMVLVPSGAAPVLLDNLNAEALPIAQRLDLQMQFAFGPPQPYRLEWSHLNCLRRQYRGGRTRERYLCSFAWAARPCATGGGHRRCWHLPPNLKQQGTNHQWGLP